jgi:putative PIN family toxin of toxin-antitoxin system
MRVVIDTNVWVSALINPNGTPAKIIHYPATFEVLTSPAILGELERVLHYDRIKKRYHLTDAVINAYLDAVRLDSLRIDVTQQVNAVARDPDDNMVLACAVQGKADYVVSGDPHLVDMVNYQGIPILIPGAFLAELERQG